MPRSRPTRTRPRSRSAHSRARAPAIYLGIVDERDDAGELRAHVADINIKRRALYTEVSVRRGTTVSEVAKSTACVLFRERVAVGEAYRRDDGTWAVREDEAPVPAPAFCR